MKQKLTRQCAVWGICLATFSTAFAQTTTTPGTPIISGFASHPVSGFNPNPVTGYSAAPVQGLNPLPRFPRVTNFTTGPISPLTTTVGGLGNKPLRPLPLSVLPPAPVAPVPVKVPNAIGTPLF